MSNPDDKQELEIISRLKDAVSKSEDSSDSEEETLPSTANSNRGQKLKRGASDVYEGKLGRSTMGHGVKVVDYEGVKRAVIYKRRKVIYDDDTRKADSHSHLHPDSSSSSSSEDSGSENDNDDDDDPYNGINLDGLLAPVTYPGDIPSHPALKRTYTNPVSKWLANRALDIITQEHRTVIKLSRLMDVFLGDDPSYILSEKLRVPPMDPVVNGNGTANGNGTSNNHNDQNSGYLPGQLNSNNSNNEQDSNRRITRGQMIQEQDPFFALPDISIDRDFGIEADQAEETRQLTQIALQRSEEFIRCMTKIQADLLKTDRYRRLVYRMCMAFNGDDDIIYEFGEDPANKKLHEKNDNN